MTTQFTGEPPWDAIINDNSLTITEEVDFRQWISRYDPKGITSIETLEMLFDRWKKEREVPEFIPDDRALYWLTRLKVAYQREGWEKGPTLEEVWDKVTSFLANRDLDAGVEKDQKNIREFLADVEYRERDRGLY